MSVLNIIIRVSIIPAIGFLIYAIYTFSHTSDYLILLLGILAFLVSMWLQMYYIIQIRE